MMRARSRRVPQSLDAPAQGRMRMRAILVHTRSACQRDRKRSWTASLASAALRELARGTASVMLAGPPHDLAVAADAVPRRLAQRRRGQLAQLGRDHPAAEEQ